MRGACGCGRCTDEGDIVTIPRKANSNRVFAPEWHVADWFNTDSQLTLGDLRGKVVVLRAFQTLCPGCVREGTPQAQRVAQQFEL